MRLHPWHTGKTEGKAHAVPSPPGRELPGTICTAWQPGAPRHCAGAPRRKDRLDKKPQVWQHAALGPTCSAHGRHCYPDGRQNADRLREQETHCWAESPEKVGMVRNKGQKGPWGWGPAPLPIMGGLSSELCTRGLELCVGKSRGLSQLQGQRVTQPLRGRPLTGSKEGRCLVVMRV